jgi:hypothetical protein
MLHGVAALVRRNCRRRYAAACIYALAEGYGLGLRIEVVCKHAVGRYDLYVIDAMVCQHFSSNVSACHSVRKSYLRILAEAALEHVLDKHADEHDYDH